MKLLNKISFYYLVNTALLFMLGLLAIYLSVDWIISERTDGQLKDTSKEIRLKLSHGVKIQYPPFVEIVPAKNKLKAEFKDTTIYLEAERENEEYRQYTAYREINGMYYKIVVRTSLIEKEDLFSAVLIVLAAVLSILLLILFLVNRTTAKKIFRPFYSNLDKLKSFSISKDSGLDLEDSNIDEFRELKGALNILAEKSLKEYRSLKEYSENLSHELQTPVAVIKVKTEMLLQHEFTNKDINDNLQSIINNVDRLDKLNRSLVLLTKLETTDLFPKQKILLSNKLVNILDDFADIALAKDIVIESRINSGYATELNENLLDILLGNLLSNAIKHNVHGGKVFIEMIDSHLTIKNNGKEPKQIPASYFKRFSCDERSPNSLGLGLAITKKICDLYQYKIQYLFENQLHIITIDFKSA